MTAYTPERRWAHICAELDRRMKLGDPRAFKPGELANTYGGTVWTKADILAEINRRNELGGMDK